MSRKFNRRKRNKRQVMAEGAGQVWSMVRRIVPWLLLLVVLVGLPMGVLSGWRHALGSSYFHVSDLTIEGHTRALEEDIHLALGYEGPETNIFTIDPGEAAARIEAEVEWVRVARVDKVLPNTVRVTIEERTLGGIALVGELMLVDEQGIPFKPLEREKGIDMAVVTGLGDSVEALGEDDHHRIVEALKIVSLYDKVEVGVHDRLAEVNIDPVFGFTLITEDKGVQVMLGEGQMEKRLKRLKEVFGELKRRSMEVTVIRLDGERSMERIAVRPVALPGSEQR